MIPRQHTASSPRGTIIISDGFSEVEHDTLQCVHCGKHWVVVRGSGIRRNFCRKCMGPTCGCQACEPSNCMPVEKRLDQYEEGKLLIL